MISMIYENSYCIRNLSPFHFFFFLPLSFGCSIFILSLFFLFNFSSSFFLSSHFVLFLPDHNAVLSCSPFSFFQSLFSLLWLSYSMYFDLFPFPSFNPLVLWLFPILLNFILPLFFPFLFYPVITSVYSVLPSILSCLALSSLYSFLLSILFPILGLYYL